MPGAHKGHVAEAQQGGLLASGAHGAYPQSQRFRQSAFGVRIDDDLEPLVLEHSGERAIGIGADRDPACRRQFDDRARGAQGNRHAVQGRQQFVPAPETARPAGGQKYGGDCARNDHPRASRHSSPILSRKVSGLAITPADILRFAVDRADAGVVLVTLVGIAGSSPRAVGAQMAVASDGASLGSFSGGCIEDAIVGEALSVLAAGEGRLVRFGKGSPYIDIRLPCGGGIDLLFTPRPDRSALADMIGRLDARAPAAMRIGNGHVVSAEPGPTPTGWSNDIFHVAFVPNVRIVAIGHGDALIATARLAQFYGAETQAFSPLPDDIAALGGGGIEASLLEQRTLAPAIEPDRWTAFAFLFHDHDWEEFLLPWALRSPHFSICAIGGQPSRTHRRDMLRRNGFAQAVVQRFDRPAGLIPATRDPAALAFSIVAEIVGRYQNEYAGSASPVHGIESPAILGGLTAAAAARAAAGSRDLVR